MTATANSGNGGNSNNGSNGKNQICVYKIFALFDEKNIRHSNGDGPVYGNLRLTEEFWHCHSCDGYNRCNIFEPYSKSLIYPKAFTHRTGRTESYKQEH